MQLKPKTVMEPWQSVDMMRCGETGNEKNADQSNQFPLTLLFFYLFALLHIKIRKGHRAVFPLGALADWAGVWFLVSFLWDAPSICCSSHHQRVMVRIRHPLEGDNRVGKKWLRPVCLRSGETIRRRELPGNLTSKRWTMTLGAFSPLSSRPILSQTPSTISRPLIKRQGTKQGATFLQMEEQGALRK